MTDELMAALDECLNTIASGATVEASLARYPALADELRPLLEAALDAGASRPLAAIPRPREMSSRAQFLTRAAELRAPARRGFTNWLLAPRALATGLAIVLALVIGTYGVVSASTQSLPGDALYGVKRAAEQAQLLLAPDPQSRAQLEEAFAARRVREAQALTAAKREAPIEFRGVIESIVGEQWSVAGITVIVTRETRVSGVPELGLMVVVSGMSQSDGAVRATDIAVLLPEATPAPAEPTSSAAALPHPSATRTPEPTERPSATPEPEASETPEPTETEAAEERSGPSASNTPKPSSTPPASETSKPTHTPGGGGGPSPSNTPEPEEVEIEGTLQSISGNVWTVAGQAVIVNANTEIRDNPHVGDEVRVRAFRQPDGTLIAERIEKR